MTVLRKALFQLYCLYAYQSGLPTEAQTQMLKGGFQSNNKDTPNTIFLEYQSVNINSL